MTSQRLEVGALPLVLGDHCAFGPCTPYATGARGLLLTSRVVSQNPDSE
jgi:hypothetical protein